MKTTTCALLAAALALPACSGPWHFRGGGYVGQSELEGADGTEVDGPIVGGRLELAKGIDLVGNNLELGARLSAGQRIGDGDSATSPGVEIELESLDFTIDAVARGYIPTDTARPYLEAFVGYGFTSQDVSALGTTVNVDSDGVTYGAGLGLEFGIGASVSLSVGAELRRNEFTTELDGDITLDDIFGVVMFGTRF